MNRIRIVFRFGSNLSQRSLVGLQSNRAWVSPCRLRQILPDDKYPALPVSGSNDFFILKKKKRNVLLISLVFDTCYRYPEFLSLLVTSKKVGSSVADCTAFGSMADCTTFGR